MVGTHGEARTRGLSPLRHPTSEDPHGQKKTAAEALRARKEQAIVRKERSAEWELEHPVEQVQTRGRRLRPVTAPEAEVQRVPSVERVPSASSRVPLRAPSAETKRTKEQKPPPKAKKAAADGGEPPHDRLYQNRKELKMPKKNKPPYAGEPHVRNLELEETLRKQESAGLAALNPPNRWASSRKGGAAEELDELASAAMTGKSMPKMLKDRRNRTARAMPKGGGTSDSSDGESAIPRYARPLRTPSGGTNANSSPTSAGGRRASTEGRLAMLLGDTGEFSKSLRQARGKSSPPRGVKGNFSPIAIKSPVSALKPGLTSEQSVSGALSIPESLDEGGSGTNLIDSGNAGGTSHGRVDPKAFNRLSERFVASRKENQSLKNVIASQNMTLADNQEHVAKLQSELRTRIDSEALGLRQIRDLQKTLETNQRHHDAEVEKLKEKLEKVSETVQEGFKKNENEFQEESNMLEELHKQLLGAGKVIAALKRRIEELNTANEGLKEGEARLEAKIKVLEEQKSLAKQQIQEEAAKAFDAAKKMRLSQEQLAKVIVRSENMEEKQDEMYQSIKASVLQISKENESLKAKVHAIEAEKNLLKADLTNSRAIIPGQSIGVQTVARNTGRGKHFYAEHWNPWVWLTTLSIICENAGEPLHTVETQTDVTDIAVAAPEENIRRVPSADGGSLILKDGAMQTEDWEPPESKKKGKRDQKQYDVWFAGIVEKCEDLLPHLHLKKTLQMSSNQLFAEISNIYSLKSVADEVDDREGFSRQRLGEFIHMHYLEQLGEVSMAEQAFLKLIVNVLAHLRGIRFQNNPISGLASAISPLRSPQKGRLAGMTNREESGDIHVRVVFFARFLGIRHENKLPLPLEALNIYLGSLMEVKKGGLPLLPTHAERILVKQAEYVQVLDWVFGHSRAIVRSKIKTDLIDMNNDWDTIDLEVALEFTITAWKATTEKWEARLQSLFTTADTDANGNLEYVEFEGMMEKLRVDEPNLPSERRRLRMYQEMALHPKVDSMVFIQVAKLYDLCKFKLGRPYTKLLHRLSAEDENLFQTLEGHVDGLTYAMEATLGQIEEAGKSSRGLGQKWVLLLDMIKERKRVSIAYAFFSQITQTYAVIARSARANAPTPTSPPQESPPKLPSPRRRSVSPRSRAKASPMTSVKGKLTSVVEKVVAARSLTTPRSKVKNADAAGGGSAGNNTPLSSTTSVAANKGPPKKAAAPLTVKTDEKYLGERPESDLETDDDDSDASSHVERAGGAVTKDEMDGLDIPEAPPEEVEVRAGKSLQDALAHAPAGVAKGGARGNVKFAR